MDHVLTVLFDLFLGAMGGIIAMRVSGSWIRKRAFAAGQKAERESHERHLEKLAFNGSGIVRKPGETTEELLARYKSFVLSPGGAGTRAHDRALLESMKPAGIELEKWVDAVLGRES